MKSISEVIRDITPEQIATIAVRHKWCNIGIYPCPIDTLPVDCYSCWVRFLNSKTAGYEQWLNANQK